MKALPILLTILLSIPLVSAVDFITDPTEMNFTGNVTHIYNGGFNLTNNGTSIWNITLSSPYITNYSENNFFMAGGEIPITFNIKMPPITGQYTSYINITANSTLHAQILMRLNVTMPPATQLPPGAIWYMNCTVTNESATICSSMNPGDVNQTIININNTTQSNYFAVSEEFWGQMIAYLNASQTKSMESINKTEELKDVMEAFFKKEREISENAIIIQRVLSNEDTPIWLQYKPKNELINFTGLTTNEINSGVATLISQKIISVKHDTKTVPVIIDGEVVSARKIQYTFIALTSRKEISENNRRLAWYVFIILFLLILSAVLIYIFKVFYPRYVDGRM